MKNVINKISNLCYLLFNIAEGIGAFGLVVGLFYFVLPLDYQMIAVAIFLFLFTISIYAILIIIVVLGPFVFLDKTFNDETPEVHKTKEEKHQ